MALTATEEEAGKKKSNQYVCVTELKFSKHPLRCSVDLVDLGAASMFFANLEFSELGHLAENFGSMAVS